MKKKILLVGYNYAPEPTGIGKYSGEMIQWLAVRGHDCTVLTTYPYYPHWSVQEPYRSSRFWYKREVQNFESGGRICVIRCPIYVPEEPSGLKRIILDFTFLTTSFFPLIGLLFQRKFNLLFAVAPSFLIGLPAWFYSFFRGGKFVYHIQDMQIEAARDLGMIKSKLLLKSLFAMEKRIGRKANTISSISTGMIEKLENKFNKSIYFFANWADISTFHPIEEKSAIKQEFGFDPGDKILLYSGGIGQKQGLEVILYAAYFYKDKPDIKFIICGSGPYQTVLKEMARDMKLANLSFLPLQPFEKFNQFLNLADVHLVIQKADACDLMMPSKLTTILAVGGLSIITANEGSGLYSLVKAHGVGIIAEAENQDALNVAIGEALENSSKNKTIQDKARAYAEMYLDKQEIMRRFEADQL